MFIVSRVLAAQFYSLYTVSCSAPTRGYSYISDVNRDHFGVFPSFEKTQSGGKLSKLERGCARAFYDPIGRQKTFSLVERSGKGGPGWKGKV